jgi:hypothetical protein
MLNHKFQEHNGLSTMWMAAEGSMRPSHCLCTCGTCCRHRSCSRGKRQANMFSAARQLRSQLPFKGQLKPSHTEACY